MIGQTKDVGFQFGLRKTYWNKIVSELAKELKHLFPNS